MSEETRSESAPLHVTVDSGGASTDSRKAPRSQASSPSERGLVMNMTRRVTHDAWGKSTHMSRYLAVLFTAGGVLGHLSLFAPHGPEVRAGGVLLTSTAALVAALMLLIVGKTLPAAGIHAFLLAGTLIITLAMFFGGTADTSGTTAIFYIWVALFAFTFFPGAAATAHLAFIASAYAVELAVAGDRDNVSQWVTVVGTIAVTGYVVGRLAHHNSELAGVDALTGLPNRRSFDRILALEVERTTRDSTPLAVAVLDVNNFKHVNDTLGHGAGDELLRVCADRLLHCVRPDDFVARLGGDEFALLMQGASAVAPQAVAERITMSLSEPIVLHGIGIDLTASIGFATATNQTSAADLLRNADLAMYVAKASRLGHYEIYDSSMHERALERLELESELRAAVATNGIGVEFQPIVSIATGEITAIELLARWSHSSRGPILPDVFIPIAERTGVICDLGDQVFQHACRIAKRLHTLQPELDITVNVSPVQLADPQLAERFAAALRESGVDPRRLVLEVTESSLMQDVGTAAERLHELKKLGVRVAVDDFGVGHSSLSYLRKFPVDVLKLDKSFIASLSDGGGQLARAVIQLGAMLGLDVVAEGVESQAQLEELTVLGCNNGQGYLFASPMSEDNLLKHLAEHSVPRPDDPRLARAQASEAPDD